MGTVMFRFLKYILLIGLWGCSKEAQAQPHLGTVSPSASVQGTQGAVTLTGTGLTCSAVGLTVSGSGITVTSPTCVNATTLTANLIVMPSAAATTHTISLPLRSPFVVRNVKVRRNGRVSFDVRVGGPGQIDVLGSGADQGAHMPMAEDGPSADILSDSQEHHN